MNPVRNNEQYDFMLSNTLIYKNVDYLALFNFGTFFVQFLTG